MVSLLKIIGTEERNGVNLPRVHIYADAKAEVTNNMKGKSIQGLGDVIGLAYGSIATTPAFEIAQYDSSGTWHWSNNEYIPVVHY